MKANPASDLITRTHFIDISYSLQVCVIPTQFEPCNFGTITCIRTWEKYIRWNRLCLSEACGGPEDTRGQKFPAIFIYRPILVPQCLWQWKNFCWGVFALSIIAPVSPDAGPSSSHQDWKNNSWENKGLYYRLSFLWLLVKSDSKLIAFDIYGSAQ